MQVVAIGASAGGIEAFRLFFEHMPADSGMAFVVVLHLSAEHKSMLPEIIARWTAMKVDQAADGQPLGANTVYVLPPGVVGTLAQGILRLRAVAPEARRDATPIDTFFDSVAAELGEQAVGIVLSGTGHDGSLGLKAIKARGGLTLAQGTDGSAPQHSGMPDSAAATGAVDLMVPVQDMPRHIVKLRAASTGRAPPTESELDAARLRICDILRMRLGHDFSHYKDKTFLRRVQRRMQVLNLAGIEAYVTALEESRDEAVLLFHDLLIGVTQFFRDESAFGRVKHAVIPRLFAGKGAADAVRVWVPGCATGEEAYSLAILLREHMDGLTDVPKVQLFATDIDEPAIGTARAGRYPPTLLAGLSDARRERFFNRSDTSYAIAREIRDLCTFSSHSLIRDPPFSRMDLVSCRNLLIYLDAELQASVIPAFHYSLVTGGVLLLGSSENIVRRDLLFTALDEEHRIFLKRDVPSPPIRAASRSIPRPGPTSGAPAPRSQWVEPGTDWPHALALANARVLERFAAPFVVVTAEGNLIHYSSHTGNYMQPALGAPSRNAFDMARRGLRLGLRAVLRQAVETGRTAEQPVSLESDDGALEMLTLTAEPLPGHQMDRPYLIVFRPTALPGPAQDSGAGTPRPGIPDHAAMRLAVQVERELRDAKEQLQSLSEEHETALEELRSSNEELHSVNEELQSSNEELETSKEEIQSINEELQTVNAQLSSKLEELDRTNSDLQNLFDSTRVATVFLDPHLVIRGFTPEVASIYNLIPSDRGRPLTDIVTRLDYELLRDDVQQVLQTLEPLERRVSRQDGTAHFLLRILPYRTPDSAVDGTLVTFVDVTSIVQAEQHQRLLVDEMNHRVKNMLSVIMSLAAQTLRRSDSLQQFSDVFMGRVRALTAAYTLLSREKWSSVGLREILTEELEPFMAENRTNVLLDGPRIALEPRAALALGMAIHELATNAVKYGALSLPEGNVVARWSVNETDDGGELTLIWQESKGPAVRVPETNGFGLSLIQRGLAHDLKGEASIEFRPGGLHAVLTVPLSRPVAGG